jgi:hypothetical protein
MSDYLYSAVSLGDVIISSLIVAYMFVCPKAMSETVPKTTGQRFVSTYSAQPAQKVSAMTSHESDQCAKCYAYICQCAKAAEAQSNTHTRIDDLNAQFGKSLSKSGFTDFPLIMSVLREMEQLGVRFTFPEKFILVLSRSYPSSGEERDDDRTIDPRDPAEAVSGGTSIFQRIVGSERPVV